MKQCLLYISLLFLCCTFATGQKTFAQKAQSLVWNGDLEIPILKKCYWELGDTTCIDCSINGWCSVEGANLDTFFNYNFSKAPFWIRSIKQNSMVGIGVMSCAIDLKIDPRHGYRILSTMTGRIKKSNYTILPPPQYDTYGEWEGGKVVFKLTDTIHQGELIYIDWIDFFVEKYKNSPCLNIYDCFQDNIQLGLGLNNTTEGTIVHDEAAGKEHWQTHKILLHAPHQISHLSIGNRGDTSALTPFEGNGWRYVSQSVISTRNYIDNLRLFRVLGSSKRDTVLCGPGPFTLPGKPGKEWEWNDSVTTQNIILNLGDSGWYVCKTFTDGFVRFDSIYVRFDEALSVQPAVDTVGCTGQVLVLPSPRVGGYTYVWSNSSTTQNIITTAAGSFWVASKKGSCTVVDTFHVVFAPKPVVYLGADTAFCGSFVHLLHAGAGKKDYTWNTGDKNSTLLVNSAGQYSVTVRDSLNCPNADTILLEQVVLNDIVITEDTLTCKYVTLTGGPLQNNVTYEWSNGAAGISTQVTQTGTYTLTASHPFCSLSKSVQVTQLPQPPQVNLGTDTTLCGYGRVVLENKNAGLPNYLYQWSNGSSAPRITVHDSGLYYLVVYRNQCSGSDSVLVAPDCEGTFYIPSAFSPNGDNLNDVFGVTGSNIISVHLRIYNRWGEELYNRKGSAESVFWNGLYKNENCIAGEYIYTVTVEVLHSDKRMQHRSGTVHLMR